MNENLNLVEILKDCPKGTKLYSTIFGDVRLINILYSAVYPIIVSCNDWNTEDFTADGKLRSEYDGECTLFPSKDQRDWSKFNPPCKFKDGDILSYQNEYLKNRTIYIYSYSERGNTAFYVALSGNKNETFIISNKEKWALNGYDETVCFATEEEKQKLFDAIKLNGYEWDSEKKELKKLVESKFDPKKLNTFDKVLVFFNGIWSCDFYSHYNDDIPFHYVCLRSSVNRVIPYNDETKHLVGTSDDAPEYYMYWED